MSRFFSSIRFVLILFLGFNNGNGNYASFDVEKVECPVLIYPSRRFYILITRSENVTRLGKAR
jgi:hypothetical protein